MEAGAEHALGANQIDLREAGQAGQQVEVGDKQAVRIGDPVRHGHDGVLEGPRGGFRQQSRPQVMLVARARGQHTRFVAAKGFCEKARLSPDPRGSGIGVWIVSSERLLEERLETSDLLGLAAQEVVEAQDLRDESGPETKRQHRHDRGRVGGRRLHQGVPLESRQPPGRIGEPRVQIVVELIAREPPGSGRRARRRGRARGGDDDHHGGRRVARRQRGDGVAEHVQVGDAHQPRQARGDHCGSCGRRNTASISARARDVSIRAPAAADEASHARARSPEAAASRRIRAAPSAICAALTSSACAV